MYNQQNLIVRKIIYPQENMHLDFKWTGKVLILLFNSYTFCYTFVLAMILENITDLVDSIFTSADIERHVI